MKIIIGVLIYFLLSGGFLFKKNGNGLSVQNSAEIKGISAIIIVLGHCTNCFNNYQISLLNLGWYIVAVFFFISGYGIALGYKHKSDYLIRFIPSRLIKVLIPFLIAHIIYIPIKIFCGTDFSSDTFFYSIIGKKTIVNNSWYCTATVIMYLAFWLCFRFFKKDKSKIIALTSVILMLTIAEYFLFGKIYSYWFLSNLSFVFGVAFSLFDFTKISNYKIILFSALGLVGSCAIIPVCNIITGNYSFPAEVVSLNLQTAFFALLIAVLIPIFQYNNVAAKFFGKISYEIYLYHGLFIFLFSRVGFLNGNFLLFFAAVLICTVAVSVPLSYINKKAVNSLLKICKV